MRRQVYLQRRDNSIESHDVCERLTRCEGGMLLQEGWLKNLARCGEVGGGEHGQAVGQEGLCGRVAHCTERDERVVLDRGKRMNVCMCVCTDGGEVSANEAVRLSGDVIEERGGHCEALSEAA